MLFIILLFFRYIKVNGGIDIEFSYFYIVCDGCCKFKEVDVGVIDIGKGKVMSIYWWFVMIFE